MIRNNKFTIIISFLILYLSLANAKTFSKFSQFETIPYFDKFVHFGLYFLFTAVLIFEHRSLFKNTRQLLLTALIPFFFGAIMEFLQADLTTTRSGDIFDLLADSVGIAIALYLWLVVKPFYREKIK
jgi:VanZ family protein